MFYSFYVINAIFLWSFKFMLDRWTCYGSTVQINNNLLSSLQTYIGSIRVNFETSAKHHPRTMDQNHSFCSKDLLMHIFTF